MKLIKRYLCAIVFIAAFAIICHVIRVNEIDSQQMTAEVSSVSVAKSASATAATQVKNLSLKEEPKVKSEAKPGVDQEVVETELRLTDLNGITLDGALVDGRWTLSKDQEVLVWMDLPTDIAYLDGKVSSSFPYEVSAGETGVIRVELVSYENHTTYVGNLEFVATDDLTLETGIKHTDHKNSGNIVIRNDNDCGINCPNQVVEPRVYMHYPLFTSAKNEPIIYDGGSYSLGCGMQYKISATGDFDTRSCKTVHKDTYRDMPTDEPDPGEDVKTPVKKPENAPNADGTSTTISDADEERPVPTHDHSTGAPSQSKSDRVPDYGVTDPHN